MADKVFVSPGVYTSELDLTFVTRQVGVTTLGVVGETTKGPAFQPIFVSNYDEFTSFFGGLNATKIKDTGAPKYELPYIAKSYLSQSNQLFVTRVLGFSGYDAGLAWGISLDAALDETSIFVTAASTLVDPLLTYSATTGGTLTSVVSNDVLIQRLWDEGQLDTELAFLATAATGATASIDTTWVKTGVGGKTFSGASMNLVVIETGSNITNQITGSTSGNTIHYSGIPYVDVEDKIVALLRSRAAYDGDENLNFELTGTTSVASDSTVTGADANPKGDFALSGTSTASGAFNYSLSFDKTKKNYITRVLGSAADDGKTALYVEELYQNMFEAYVTDSKVRGINAILVDYASTMDDYREEFQPAVTPWVVSELRGTTLLRLFRLWTISDGNAANKQFKIAIKNIKLDDREFDIEVRAYGDTDAKPIVLERFTRCSMNPTSNGYVAKKVGTLDGDFASKSNYILIEMEEDSDTSDAFPGGFMGFPIRDYQENSNTTVQSPSVEYKQTYGVFENKRKFYLGLSEVNGIDQDFFDYKGNPSDTNLFDYSGMTKGFHMDVDANTGTIDNIDVVINTSGDTFTPTVEFEVGNAEFRTEAGVASTDYEKVYARKFTFAPTGGFDGWDIYRTRRTNRDKYTNNGTAGQAGLLNGVFSNKALTNGDLGIDSDYYAYLEAIWTFNNPEAVNTNVFATPGIDTFDHTNLVEEAIEMIEQDRADSLYVVTTPDTDASGDVLLEEDVIDTLDGQFDSNYTATYWPWIQINDSENNIYTYVPATRDVVRNIALTDNIAFPWFAVAGVQRGDVNAIKARKKLTQTQRDTLYEGRVNPIATFATEGIKIWGNKTLQVKDTALNRINVRRLLLQARKLISAVSIRLLFEQNDDIVRNQFLSLVNPILDNIRSERGLTDFRVVLDVTPESIDRNELCGRIFLKPTRALEFICVEFNIMNTGASFDDI
tara:strand:+ start:25808 stop:28657 length:2850 start_codon:yes stop_codon:yes gene_type:complete